MISFANPVLWSVMARGALLLLAVPMFDNVIGLHAYLMEKPWSHTVHAFSKLSVHSVWRTHTCTCMNVRLRSDEGSCGHLWAGKDQGPLNNIQLLALCKKRAIASPG